MTTAKTEETKSNFVGALKSVPTKYIFLVLIVLAIAAAVTGIILKAGKTEDTIAIPETSSVTTETTNASTSPVTDKKTKAQPTKSDTKSTPPPRATDKQPKAAKPIVDDSFTSDFDKEVIEFEKELL